MTPQRRALVPSPTLPLVYLGGAHLSLATALAVLAVRPETAGPFFYHPRALALIHLLTLGWITASILGALYIVAPLVWGIPLRATRLDAWACVSFWCGTIGVCAGFWTGRYAIVGAGAPFVFVAVLVTGIPTLHGLPRTRLPAGVVLHIALAFLNMAATVIAGLALAVDRATGTLPWSPMALAAAHAHLAALGWAAMLVMGTAYRLIPMFVPAAMPTGRTLVASALLLEIGTVGLAVSLATGGAAIGWALCIAAAFGVFLAGIAASLRRRKPRPVDLPRRDWSTWQTGAAFVCLILAIAVGLRAAAGGASPATLWAYGTLGLLGFLGQVVVGIAGRLVPLFAWYRALERRDGAIPARSVHRLIDSRLAGVVFALWLAGLPAVTAGLADHRPWLTAAGAALLLVATIANAGHGAVMLVRAGGGDGR